MHRFRRLTTAGHGDLTLEMDVHRSRSFVCFICKATALARQANGLPEPAIEEGLFPLVSTEIEVRRDLAARHIVDDPAKEPGITRRLYEALNGSYYDAAGLMFKELLRFVSDLNEQLYLWHHGFQRLYIPSEQWSDAGFVFFSSARYMEYFDSPTHATSWLMRYCPLVLARTASEVASFGAYDQSPSTAFTIETKKEPEDEFKYVSVETATLDERVWIAPRYSVEPRFYSHLSVEQTSHVQNEDINSSRRTDELDHFTRLKRTNELASPADLRLSNELRNNTTMGTPGRSPAPLIKASPIMSNALLYDVPSATGNPAQYNEATPSMNSDFRLFDAQQRRANTQSFAHFDFPNDDEISLRNILN